MLEGLNNINNYHTDYCFYQSLCSVKKGILTRVVLCFFEIIGLGIMVGL